MAGKRSAESSGRMPEVKAGFAEIRPDEKKWVVEGTK